MLRAAILAAGEGSRLAAGGIATPKALVPVGGAPMIVRLARQLAAIGAQRIDALVHPRASDAESLLAAAGLDVHCRFETTRASFLSLCALLPALEGEPFLLCLVDSVFETAELAGLVGEAQSSAVPLWLGVTSFVHDDSPLRVKLEGDRVVTAVGGAEAAASPFVTGGVYWFGSGTAERAGAARALGVERLRDFLSGLVRDGVAARATVFRRIVDVDTVADLRLLQAER